MTRAIRILFEFSKTATDFMDAVHHKGNPEWFDSLELPNPLRVAVTFKDEELGKQTQVVVSALADLKGWEFVGPLCPGSISTSIPKHDMISVSPSMKYGSCWKCLDSLCRRVHGTEYSMTRKDSPLLDFKEFQMVHLSENSPPRPEPGKFRQAAKPFSFKSTLEPYAYAKKAEDIEKAAEALMGSDKGLKGTGYVPTITGRRKSFSDHEPPMRQIPREKGPVDLYKADYRGLEFRVVLNALTEEDANELLGHALKKFPAFREKIQEIINPFLKNEVGRLGKLNWDLSENLDDSIRKVEDLTRRNDTLEVQSRQYQASAQLAYQHDDAFIKSVNKLMTTVAGINLQDHDTKEQREVRDRFQEVRKFLVDLGVVNEG